MTMPIIIYRPKLVLQPLDDEGEADGEAVDVTCDVSSIELGVDQPVNTVSTFCGKFQVPDDIEESATIEITVNADTDSNWEDLVGQLVEARVWDRHDATRHRKFNAHIGANPSHYGTTQPGEPRTISFDLPVLSAVAWADGGYTEAS